MSKKKIFVIDDSVVGGSPIPTPTQEKTVTLTANNSQQIVTPDSGYLLSKVIAKAQVTTEHKVITDPITANGTYSFTPSDSAHPMDSISIPVNVPSGGVELPATISRMAFKTFSGNSSTNTPIVINHGFGDTPDMVVVFWNGNDGGLSGYVAKYLIRVKVYGENKGAFRYATSNFANDSIPYMDYDGENITFTPSTSVRFMSGTVYTVMMCKFSASSALSVSHDTIKMDMGKEVGEFAELPIEEVTE